MSIDDFSGIHVGLSFPTPSFRDVRVLAEHFFSDFEKPRELTPTLFCVKSKDGNITVFFDIKIPDSLTPRFSGPKYNYINISTEENTRILEERQVTRETMKATLDEFYSENPVSTRIVKVRIHSPVIAEVIGKRFCPSSFKLAACNNYFDINHAEYVLYNPKNLDEKIRLVFSHGWLMISAPVGLLSRELGRMTEEQLQQAVHDDIRSHRPRDSQENLRLKTNLAPRGVSSANRSRLIC
jgi:hypothetical protein